MKLFGSKKALMNERLRQKESGILIIHPCSNFRLVSSIVYLLYRQFELQCCSGKQSYCF